MNETLTLQFDGGSRGNPGPAGIGVVVSAEDGTTLVALGRFIGRATNNVAEYRALITAMEQAKTLGATKIIIRGDSQLVVRQMLGEYRVKHPDMKVLHAEATQLLREFSSAKIEHNLRHKNELADRLANLAMDSACGRDGSRIKDRAMQQRLRVGVIGVGAISAQYLDMAAKFPVVEMAAVADLDRERAQTVATKFNIPKVLSVDELIGDSEIDCLILNLTIPKAHVPVGLKILAAGKTHVL